MLWTKAFCFSSIRHHYRHLCRLCRVVQSLENLKSIKTNNLKKTTLNIGSKTNNIPSSGSSPTCWRYHAKSLSGSWPDTLHTPTHQSPLSQHSDVVLTSHRWSLRRQTRAQTLRRRLHRPPTMRRCRRCRCLLLYTPTIEIDKTLQHIEMNFTMLTVSF